MSLIASAARLLASLTPDELTRDAAREAAAEELSERQYVRAEPNLLVKAVRRLGEALGDLIDRAGGAAPGGALGLIALLILLGVFVALVLVRVGPLARRTAGGPLFAGVGTSSAAEHRARAEQAAAEGRFADAVRERLRAVVRELEARGALDPRPGRTAGEVARDGGAAVPAVAEDLRRGAHLFDEIWYGGRPADAASYAVLTGVDERVSATRLTVA